MRINTQFSRGKGRSKRRSKARRSIMPQLKRAMTRWSNKPPVIKGLVKGSRSVNVKFCQMFQQPALAVDNEDIIFFSANGCTDPNISVAGINQIACYGFTEYAAIYNKYKVVASTIKITSMLARQVTGNPDQDPNRYYVTVGTAGNEHQNTTLVNFENQILTGDLSMKNVKQQVYSDKNYGIHPYRPIVITRSWQLKNWKKVLSDYSKEDFWINTTASPNGLNEPRFNYRFHLDNHNFFATDHSTVLQSSLLGPITTWMVEIQYKVIFRDPKPNLAEAYTND